MLKTLFKITFKCNKHSKSDFKFKFILKYFVYDYDVSDSQIKNLWIWIMIDTCEAES